MIKVDKRTQVRKGIRGHLLNAHPDKEWPEILVALLTEHGSVKAVARAINVTEQVVYEWVGHEINVAKTIQVKRQPPRIWELT